MQRLPHVYVAESEIDGKGVFTWMEIPEGSIIEICPIIRISVEDMKLLDKTVLYNYCFQWGEEGESGAVVLGFGSIYNHSYNCNARYLVDFEDDTVHFVALRDIGIGEEIFTNYNGEPEDKSPLWFEVKQ